MTKGIISEIRPFSTYDGPGIRTTVFLKGCPLRCEWCSNPETWKRNPQIYFFSLKCQHCGECFKVCSEKAITMDEVRIIRDKCTSCMRCVEVCPFGALSLVGMEMTVDEVATKVKSDMPFFIRSGGGLTVSGGEPLFQPAFTAELMEKCRSLGINTCLDTCAFVETDILREVGELCDLILISLKHMDNDKHLKLTGVSNRLILENIKIISQEKPVRLSFPVIPSANDSSDNIRETAKFAQLCGIKNIDIEPYHRLGEAKYEALGMKSPYENFGQITEQTIIDIIKIFDSFNINITRGRIIK